MLVVIHGAGVTGTATGAVLSDAGIKVEYVDPPKGISTNEKRPDFAFVCVPTPTGDLNYVVKAIGSIIKTYKPIPPIVLRSTVPPGTVWNFYERVPSVKIILMPEFLREQYALEDAMKRDKAIYACMDDVIAEKFAQFLAIAGYRETRRVSVQACEFVKIALNSMLAIKVAFANVLYEAARKNGANYDEIVDLMLMDGWLSKFGLQVPGRHGRGFSGTCLPKDLGWLQKVSKESGDVFGSYMLDSVQTYNAQLRQNTQESAQEVQKDAVK